MVIDICQHKSQKFNVNAFVGNEWPVGHDDKMVIRTWGEDPFYYHWHLGITMLSGYNDYNAPF